VATKKTKKKPAARTTKTAAKKAAKKTSTKKAAQKSAKKPAKKTAKKAAKKAATKKAATKRTAKKTAKKKPAKSVAGALKKAKKKAKGVVKKARAAVKQAGKKVAKKAKAVVKKATRAAKKATAPVKKAARKVQKKASGGATATIVQHVFVPAPPQAVYEALTDPVKHGAFTGTECTGQPVVGGTFIASSGYIHGRFLELVPGKRVVQEWVTTEWPTGAGPSKLELDLDPTAGGTELTMTHSEVPSAQADDYRQGWMDYYWHPLRRHFSADK
jgi:uncharacterized protein YndB with AHSA1/START domain